MHKLTMYFGAQCIACRASLQTCESLAQMFEPDVYLIEPMRALFAR